MVVRRHIVLIAFALGFCSVASARLPIYQYIGQFGEVVYSQTPPIDKQYHTLSVLHGTQTTPATDCQRLQKHLSTLDAGGVIHEIDSSGNKTLLNDEQVTQRKTQIRDTLKQYCHG